MRLRAVCGPSPATPEQIEELTRIAGGVLDEELRKLLTATRGFGADRWTSSISGDRFSLGIASMFPRMHPGHAAAAFRFPRRFGWVRRFLRPLLRS